VVLGHHRQALVLGVEARALGDRPALEHALHLETEVVVQARGRVLLDHEGASLLLLFLASRLGRDREVALAVVLLQAHRRPPPLHVTGSAAAVARRPASWQGPCSWVGGGPRRVAFPLRGAAGGALAPAAAVALDRAGR